jgi:hypothetical protein
MEQFKTRHRKCRRSLAHPIRRDMIRYFLATPQFQKRKQYEKKSRNHSERNLLNHETSYFVNNHEISPKINHQTFQLIRGKESSTTAHTPRPLFSNVLR